MEAYNDWKSAHEFGEFPDLVDSLTQITQPVLEMTMLQGLNDMIKSAKYSDGSELASIGTGALTNLATQGIPTVFGQVARAVDPLRRTIYNDPNSKIPGDEHPDAGRSEHDAPKIGGENSGNQYLPATAYRPMGAYTGEHRGRFSRTIGL